MSKILNSNEFLSIQKSHTAKRDFMMFNKKGVSEVVANVLIVLLVIVGIAVIWSVVKPTIERTADVVQSDCFTVQVEPVSCVKASDTTAGATFLEEAWNVTIKRNPGAGNFENVELVFEDANGNVIRNASNIVTPAKLSELGTLLLANVSTTNPATATEVNIVLKANGQLCQVTTSPIPCS